MADQNNLIDNALQNNNLHNEDLTSVSSTSDLLSKLSLLKNKPSETTVEKTTPTTQIEETRVSTQDAQQHFLNQPLQKSNQEASFSSQKIGKDKVESLENSIISNQSKAINQTHHKDSTKKESRSSTELIIEPTITDKTTIIPKEIELKEEAIIPKKENFNPEKILKKGSIGIKNIFDLQEILNKKRLPQ